MDETAEPGPPHVRPEDMRAGAADREQVLERLRVAHAEGRLDAAELDERIAATLAARTYGELAVVVADLPGDAPSPRPLGVPLPRPSAPPERLSRQAKDLGPAVAAWVGVTVTMIAVWVVGCVAAGAVVFPWWLLVATPWGLGLLRVWTGRRGPEGGSPGAR